MIREAREFTATYPCLCHNTLADRANSHFLSSPPTHVPFHTDDCHCPTFLLIPNHDRLQRQASPNIVIALVGNKLDLVAESDAAGSTSTPKKPTAASDDEDASEAEAEAENPEGESDADETTTTTPAPSTEDSLRQISHAEASAYARESNLLFFEASAKDGTNVKELFDEIARTIPLDNAASPGQGTAGAAGSASAARGRREGQEVRLGEEQAKKGGCC